MVKPFLNNVIILITFIFAAVGIAFGYARGKFNNIMDVVQAMLAQMNTMGYVLVLIFSVITF